MGAGLSEITGGKKCCLNCTVLQNEEGGVGQNLQFVFVFITFIHLFGGKLEIL